ncbi:type II toxin-antitoxin system MqsR family toxin [Pseudomonas sp. PDM22]|uniref:type II toxin-antitoxin system MqsR family toxin n=1 Tax=Pseudomonas sp. PDM22 TaxID=2769287 RepID=UPI00399B64C3
MPSGDIASPAWHWKAPSNWGLESTEQVLAVITGLTSADFYKSMTTYADHSIWQDVYRPWVNGRQAYVKLTLQGDLLIVSFKEK